MSLEALAAISSVLIIFIFMLFFAFRINEEKQSAEERSMTESQCMRLSTVLQKTYMLGPGSQFNITTDYNATFESGDAIVVKSENKESFCNPFVSFTNGTDDEFVMEKGRILLKNIDGTILIQKEPLS